MRLSDYWLKKSLLRNLALKKFMALFWCLYYKMRIFWWYRLKEDLIWEASIISKNYQILLEFLLSRNIQLRIKMLLIYFQIFWEIIRFSTIDALFAPNTI